MVNSKRLISRKNNNPLHLVRGFTLLELLIASGIFAAAIVMLVSAFGLSTKYQREIRANRDLSYSVRQALMEITKEVEYSYNQPVPNLGGEIILQNGKSVYNFAVMRNLASNTTPPDIGPGGYGQGGYLFINDRQNHCRYYAVINQRLAYFSDKKIECGNPSRAEGAAPDWQGPFYLTGKETVVNSIIFSGVMNTAGKPNQAYLWMTIDTQNAWQDEFALQMGNRTVATIRNFGREI